MRLIPFSVVLVLLLLGPADVLGPASAEEPSEARRLLAAVKACPVSLIEAMGVTHGADHRPIDGTFLLDTDGKLLLRCTVRVAAEDEPVRFETWMGHVHGGGWVPTSRPLEGDAAKDAARRWAVIEGSDVLRFALMKAVPSGDVVAPADVAISVAAGAPGAKGKATATLRVGVGDAIKGLRFESADASFRAMKTPAVPARVRYDAGSLPALPAEGTWFHAGDKPPTLAGLRGGPVLVVITDPG